MGNCKYLHCKMSNWNFQINHLEEALKAREEGIEDAHHSHEDQLNKLSTLTKERELSWQKQKEEIEAHYQQLLDEMQSRVKVNRYCIDLAVRGFVLLKTTPKNVDPSYKVDLDFWNCLGREKSRIDMTNLHIWCQFAESKCPFLLILYFIGCKTGFFFFFHSK